MKKRLVINSLSGAGQFIFSALLLLITVPIFIKKMGIEHYGIYSLVLITNSFNSFIGLGLNSGLIKFLSEQGKSKESDTDIFAVSLFLIAIMIPFTLAGLYFNDFILQNLLHIPQKYFNPDTIAFYNFLLIANFFQFLGQIPVAVLDSLQKIYLTSIYQTIYQILYWSGTLLFLFLFGTLNFIGLGILISTVIWFLLVLQSSMKEWGTISVTHISGNELKISLKKQIVYNIKIYLSNLINFFYEPLSKILIASFIGIAEVSYFDIILKFRTQVWSLLAKFLYPLIPFLSNLKEKSAISNVVRDIEQKLTYAILFLIVIVICIVPDFLRIWLKMDSTLIVTGMIWILSINLISIILVPLYQFLMLKGYPGKTIIIQSSNVIINLIIFFLLYKSQGFYAAIWGVVGANIFSTGVCVYYQYKYLNSSIFNSSMQIIKIIIFFVLLLAVGELIDLLIINPYVEIIALPVILLFPGLYLMRQIGAISVEDIQRYSGSNQKLRFFMTKMFVKN